MKALRFITAGNVDDGKSTLTGRLLYDSGSIHTDQLGVIKGQSKTESLDLALVTDGLRAERAQGITIDVAYRYFSTSQRNFILADTPGHAHYTRNMVTGASNAEAMLLLIDVQQGVTAQTMRHAGIAAFMGIQSVVFVLNKMDLVNYDEAVYLQLCAELKQRNTQWKFADMHLIPTSALLGDNVVRPSNTMLWYKGKTILDTLETLTFSLKMNLPARFQVQYILHNASAHYKGIAGPVLSGCFAVGDEVMIFPQQIVTHITKIEKNATPQSTASERENIVLHLERAVEIQRGDTIVKVLELPQKGKEIEARICWLDDMPMQPNIPYRLQHRFCRVEAIITQVVQKWEIQAGIYVAAENTLSMNEIAKVKIRTSAPLFYDSYDQNPRCGSAILIDTHTHQTVAAVLFE